MKLLKLLGFALCCVLQAGCKPEAVVQTSPGPSRFKIECLEPNHYESVPSLFVVTDSKTKRQYLLAVPSSGRGAAFIALDTGE